MYFKIAFIFYNKVLLILDFFIYGFFLYWLQQVKFNYYFLGLVTLSLLSKLIYEQLLYKKDVGLLKMFGLSSLSLLFLQIVGHFVILTLSYLGLYFLFRFLSIPVHFFDYKISFFYLFSLNFILTLLIQPFLFFRDILSLLK